MIVTTQGKTLKDYLKWCVHQAFCFKSIPLKAGANALAVGDSLLGRVFVASGADYKLVDAVSGAAIDETSDVIICLDQRKVQTAVLANALIGGGKKLVLAAGPALVQKEDIELLLPAEVDEALLEQALNAIGIRYVAETGATYSPFN